MDGQIERANHKLERVYDIHDMQNNRSPIPFYTTI